MNHDRLFKELLSSFFFEFIELFFPDLARQIDRSHAPVFLDKESFGEPSAGSKREKDLVVQVRFHSQDAYFIVHVEHEAQNRPNFPQRMFTYFTRLLERHGPPIYPIAVFSQRTSRPRADRYQLAFDGFQILDFRFLALELAQLDWNEYVNRPNPVASALMARMKIAHQDRAKVKLACLRLLTTLRLSSKKRTLVANFVSSYLQLSEAEVRNFEERVEILPQEERRAVMAIRNHWVEQGREEGRQLGLEEGRREGRREGRQEAVAGLRDAVRLALTFRFGSQADSLVKRLAQFDVESLERLTHRLAAAAELSELEGNLSL